MDAQELKIIGKLLYGERWQSQLARDLDVGSRTVRAWLQGKNAIRNSVANDIYLLAYNKANAIDDFLAEGSVF